MAHHTDPPSVPGWDVAVDDGTLIATRQHQLTEYQRAWGALAEVTARTAGELWLLCDAQTRLAERLATAESVRPKVVPVGLRQVRAVEPLQG